MFTKFILEGYNRLMLSGITRIELNMKEIIALLVLGTNGSGKSSLLYEMHMCAIEVSDFNSDGYKYIELENDGICYASEVRINGGKAKYQFYKDGQALNDSQSVTFQKQLVKDHLGHDMGLHLFILGLERFTMMSPAKRKEWLLRICPRDYSYAISLFKKAQEALRDNTGALKICSNQYAVESAKLCTSEYATSIEQACQQLTQVMEILIRDKPQKPNLAIDKVLLAQGVNQVCDALLNKAAKICSLGGSFNGNIDQEIQRLGQISAAATAVLTQLNTQHTQASQSLEQAINHSSEKKAQYEKEISQIDDRLSSVRSALVFKPMADNLNSVRQCFNRIRNELSLSFTELAGSAKHELSTQHLRQMMDKYDSMATELTRLEISLDNDRQKLAHMQAHKDINDTQCPRCLHEFSSVYNPNQEAELNQRIRNTSFLIDAIRQSKPELKQQIDNTSKKISLLSRYRQLVSDNTVLANLWEYIQENKIISSANSTLDDILNRYDVEIEIWVEIQSLLTKRSDLMQCIVGCGDAVSANSQAIQAKLNEIEEQLNTHTNQYVQASQQYNSLVKLKQYTEMFYADYRVLRSHITQISNMKNYEIETIRHTQYDRLMADVAAQLGKYHAISSQIQAQVAIVERLQSEQKRLQDKIDTLKLLCQTLSPTEGLVAHGIYGFLNGLTADMIEVLSSIWTYDFIIEPPKVNLDSLEIDYRFPIVVDGQRRWDCSAGSSAMLEAIDFAFRYISQKALGLTYLPLFLDEFAHRFDDEHRNNAAKVISNIIDAQEFDQLVMVSHYRAIYSAVSNVTTCVLSADNIEAGKDFSNNDDNVLISRSI